MTNGSDPNASPPPPQRFVPLLLRELPRWCTWKLFKNRQGAWTKRPDIKTTDHAAGRKLSDIKVALSREQGLGFLTGVGRTPRGFLIALDFDNCRDPATGDIRQWAKDVIKLCHNSFAEVSPSGYGLRQWVLLNTLPPRGTRSVINVGLDPMIRSIPGCNKTIELQLFGLKEGGGYVTVTGEQVEGTSPDILRIASLKPIFEMFDTSMEAGAAGELTELPVGEGVAPSRAAIEGGLRLQPNGLELIEGDWHATDAASASDAYFELARRTLIAAKGHAEAAIDYLLNCTVWGDGNVEDSKDPGKYAREEWVRTDMLRVAGKTPIATADVFDAFEDDENWQPPAEPTRALTMPAAQWIDTIGQLRFIIKDFMPAEGTFQVIGAPGCGKSQMMLSLAWAIATGAPDWFGMPILKHGPVLFIVGEGRQGFANRIRAEAIRRGEPVPKNLHVSVMPAGLDDPREVKRWLKQLPVEIPGLVMGLADTMTSNTSGTFDENDVKSMKTLFTHGTMVSRELSCVFGFVHHTGYSNQHRGRGSSAQKGAVDCDFLVTKQALEAVDPSEACTAEGDALEITLAPDRTKDWQQGSKVVGSVRSVLVYEDVTAPVIVEGPVTRVPIVAFGDDQATSLLVLP